MAGNEMKRRKGEEVIAKVSTLSNLDLYGDFLHVFLS